MPDYRFTYDGDGSRVKQVVTGGNTTLYINKYYEKNERLCRHPEEIGT